MANIYDGAFRTILNDCRKLIIPVSGQETDYGHKFYGFRKDTEEIPC